MGTTRLMQALSRCFTDGAADALAPLLAKDCVYHSQFGGDSFSSAAQIIAHMKASRAAADETTAYSCKEENTQNA